MKGNKSKRNKFENSLVNELPKVESRMKFNKQKDLL